MKQAVRHRKSIGTLLVFTIFVPELISGATQPFQFLNPVLLVLFLIGYGLPVLLIRELAVRFEVGTSGILFFGIAYGFVNEGLLAKTLTLTQNIPINVYDHYGVVAGISFPWTAAICTWHALMSVVFPIYFTQFFNPNTSDEPWITDRTAIGLGLLLFAIWSSLFLSAVPVNRPGAPIHLLIYFALIATLLGLGLRFKGQRPALIGRPSLAPALLGYTMLVPFIVLAVLAHTKANLFVFYGTLAGFYLLYNLVLNRASWLSLPAFLSFGLGMYAHYATFTFIFLLRSPVADLISVSINLAIVIFLAAKLIRNKVVPEVFEGGETVAPG